MGRVGAGLRGSFLASRGIPNGIVAASVRQTAAATIVFGKTEQIQSGASSQAKIGGAYFSGVTGSIQDPIAVPGPCEVTEP